MKKKYIFWLVVIALLWLPIGTPEDFITVPLLINTVGFPSFVLISGILVYLLFKNKGGVNKIIKK